MIEGLLAVLAAADLEPDLRELRDALWLARHIVIAERAVRAAPPLHEPQPTLPATAAAKKPTAPAGAATGELYAAGSWSGDSSYLRAIEARSPAFPALRHQLQLARALKPFKRRVPARTSFVIDEAATAARVAEEGIWLPVLRPASARWLDLALVVDTSPSMVVWRRTLAELRTLAERLGAFRIVRVLAIDGSKAPSEPLTVRPGSITGRSAIGLDRGPATLIDPTYRQAILVVTDAVSGAWRDGRMDTLLRRWGEATPVAVATVLPQRMWAGTGIRAVPAQLHAPTPGAANRTLRARARGVSYTAADPVPIPVMELSARWAAQWAQIVAGVPAWRNAALLASPAAVAAPTVRLSADRSAAEVVRRFRAAASPTAFKLACYLSAAWLCLPVMRLVQRVMLPESDTAHLAEVFLSGLLRAVHTGDGTTDPEIVQYDFLPGVRDELNTYLLRDEMLDVLRETSLFITERFGQPLDFAALLADPEGTPLPALAGDGGQPMAYIAATVLAKLGGRYRLLASRLATAEPAITVTGSFGKTPNVSIPEATAGSNLTVRTLIQGTGATLTKSDAMAANFVLYFWDGTSSSLKANTFTSNPTVIGGTMLPGLESALIGKKVGSRVLAVIPPAEGYGTAGNSQLDITGTTTLVFVIDVLKAYSNTASATGTQVSNGGGTLPTVTAKAASAPTLTFPSSSPPSELVTTTLVEGNGPKIVKGDYVISQYTGYIWRTKEVFGSSWSSGSPFGVVIGASPEQVIPGWDKGLVGQTVGSRVMLCIPPADGYGSAGQSQAGITGEDTLVFVVDIIDALKQG